VTWGILETELFRNVVPGQTTLSQGLTASSPCTSSVYVLSFGIVQKFVRLFVAFFLNGIKKGTRTSRAGTNG
jgi:hypothetical protein